jgi:membrane associated rhomboid family serine protease
MVTTSGFSNTPVTRALILGSIAASILASVLDIKHLLAIKPTPHLWPYLQFSRILTFQIAQTSSTELLFSTALLYQFRVLERLWGSRKYASFVAVCFGLNVLLLPTLCVVLKVFTLGVYNYLPSGLTAVVFAALSAWTDEAPRLSRYKIVTSPTDDDDDSLSNAAASTASGGTGGGSGIVLTDKSTTYLLAAQLALSQFPYQILPALVGWTVGTAWMGELLPGRLNRWRIPRWMVGDPSQSKTARRGQYEGLRRRLEEEGSSADGMRNVSDNMGAQEEPGGRRGFGRQILGYFTGS